MFWTHLWPLDNLIEMIHWLFLFSGDEVVYLDPHTTQEAGSVAKKATETEVETDKSYHCMYAQRMPFEHLDPSLALVIFYLKSLWLSFYLSVFLWWILGYCFPV